MPGRQFTTGSILQDYLEAIQEDPNALEVLYTLTKDVHPNIWEDPALEEPMFGTPEDLADLFVPGAGQAAKAGRQGLTKAAILAFSPKMGKLSKFLRGGAEGLAEKQAYMDAFENVFPAIGKFTSKMPVEIQTQKQLGGSRFEKYFPWLFEAPTSGYTKLGEKAVVRGLEDIPHEALHWAHQYNPQLKSLAQKLAANVTDETKEVLKRAQYSTERYADELLAGAVDKLIGTKSMASEAFDNLKDSDKLLKLVEAELQKMPTQAAPTEWALKAGGEPLKKITGGKKGNIKEPQAITDIRKSLEEAGYPIEPSSNMRPEGLIKEHLDRGTGYTENEIIAGYNRPRKIGEKIPYNIVEITDGLKKGSMEEARNELGKFASFKDIVNRARENTLSNKPLKEALPSGFGKRLRTLFNQPISRREFLEEAGQAIKPGKEGTVGKISQKLQTVSDFEKMSPYASEDLAGIFLSLGEDLGEKASKKARPFYWADQGPEGYSVVDMANDYTLKDFSTKVVPHSPKNEARNIWTLARSGLLDEAAEYEILTWLKRANMPEGVIKKSVQRWISGIANESRKAGETWAKDFTEPWFVGPAAAIQQMKRGIAKLGLSWDKTGNIKVNEKRLTELEELAKKYLPEVIEGGSKTVGEIGKEIGKTETTRRGFLKGLGLFGDERGSFSNKPLKGVQTEEGVTLRAKDYFDRTFFEHADSPEHGVEVLETINHRTGYLTGDPPKEHAGVKWYNVFFPHTEEDMTVLRNIAKERKKQLDPGNLGRYSHVPDRSLKLTGRNIVKGLETPTGLDILKSERGSFSNKEIKDLIKSERKRAGTTRGTTLHTPTEPTTPKEPTKGKGWEVTRQKEAPKEGTLSKKNATQKLLHDIREALKTGNFADILKSERGSFSNKPLVRLERRFFPDFENWHGFFRPEPAWVNKQYDEYMPFSIEKAGEIFNPSSMDTYLARDLYKLHSSLSDLPAPVETGGLSALDLVKSNPEGRFAYKPEAMERLSPSIRKLMDSLLERYPGQYRKLEISPEALVESIYEDKYQAYILKKILDQYLIK